MLCPTSTSPRHAREARKAALSQSRRLRPPRRPVVSIFPAVIGIRGRGRGTAVPELQMEGV